MEEPISIEIVFSRCKKQFKGILSESQSEEMEAWADHVGLHKQFQASLEYRARDNSTIKERVIKTLQDLQSSLEDLEKAINKPEPQDVQEFHEAIEINIERLGKSADLLDLHYPRNLVFGPLKEVASPPEVADDEGHVSEIYPSADRKLVERLGRATSQRRAVLRYRERQYQKKPKAGKGNDGDAADTQAEDPPEIYDKPDSDTFYSPTLFETNGQPSIPAPPESVGSRPFERPFECPYCHFEIVVKDMRDWAQHIFDDILPYTCTFPGCRRLFDRRARWYRHIESEHLKDKDEKTNNFTDTCPLCKNALPSGGFESHVGEHLEQLALFALDLKTSIVPEK